VADYSKPTVNFSESKIFKKKRLGAHISVSEEGLVCQEDFDIKYKDRYIFLQIHYKARGGVTEAQLLSYFRIKSVYRDSIGYFGMGSIYKIFQENAVLGAKRRIGSLKARRIIQDWGSGISHDIAAYHLNLESNPYFSDILIIFLNVLPELKETDYPLNDEHVALANGKNAPRYQGYLDIDNWLSTWTVTNDRN